MDKIFPLNEEQGDSGKSILRVEVNGSQQRILIKILGIIRVFQVGLQKGGKNGKQ